MTDFERIRDSVLGDLEASARVPWAEDLSREGTPYSEAYRTIAEARERLCQRFGIRQEDADWEAIMDAILVLEQEVARGVFQAALRCAEADKME